METKYPAGGNRMIRSDSMRGTQASVRRPGSVREGIALISVIAVLVLLMIVATPFLLSMRDSARRGEQFLYSVRVEAEAEALFDQVRGRLVQNIEHIERRRLDMTDAGGTGAATASGSQRPPDDATPTSDSPSELALSPEMLREFNKISGAEHRVWGVEIIDAQSRFDLNTCSFPILSNLLGRAELTSDIESGDDRLEVSDATAFSPTGGAVRIGAEVIKYTGIEGSILVGCKRGHMTEKGNGGAAQHAAGALVIDEAAYQIAMRPFVARPGSRIRYTNVYEARAIADQGVATISPERFDSMRRFVTAWAGSIVGDGWSNPQNVRANVTAGDAGERYIDIKNIRYFGVGTIVKITDGVNSDYGVIVGVRGSNQVAFAGSISHDYLADQARLYGLCRTPINVNTADEETLTLVFSGLKLRGRGQSVGRDTAARLASYLKQYKLEAEPRKGVFRTWEDFVKTVEAAREANVVDQDQAEAVIRNALNANDSTLDFGTVPLCFRSFDVYEARATAVLLDQSGAELGRRELRRTFDVGSARSSLSVLETQADFQEQTRLSRDSKWFASAPKNINAYYDGVNIPPSEYPAYAERGRFPDTDRSPAVGHVQLAAGAYRFAGQGRTDRYVHFDEQDDPEGLDLSKQAFSMGVDGPYSAKDRLAEVVRFVDLPNRGNTEIGLAPFSCSFWYKPGWDQNDNSERIIFDIGLGEFMNRVTLRHDPSRRALVLACADATREKRAAEIRYDYDHTTWMKDQWYHIACTVYGASPELMELFIDGQKQGNATLMTRTIATISPTGAVQRIDVTAGSAADFPATGVLAMNGTEGFELFEYTSRDDNGFNISRRKARSIDGNVSPEPNRTHPSGTEIRLYGYAAPLLTDVRRGGSTLENAMGPYRVFRLHGTDEMVISGTDNSGNAFSARSRGMANLDGYQPVITLTEWDTASVESGILDDLGPQGTVGLAMVVSSVYTVPPLTSVTTTITGSGTNFSGSLVPALGGVNIVAYTVGQTSTGGLSVTINQQGISLPHYDSSQINAASSASNAGRFFLTYDYGIDPNGTHPMAGYGKADNNNTTFPFDGSFTAFIPIALVASGTGGDYLRPADEEQQLGSQNGATFVPGSAFVQVDSEWFKYDSIDTTNLSGRLAFVRDFNMDAIANLFGNAGIITETPATPGQSGGQGGGAGTSSDTEPPVATDLNTSQYNPTSPTAGTQPPIFGTTSVPEQSVPAGYLTVDIARAHDFRGWQDANTQVYQRIANTVPADHSAGAQIIPCFALAPADWDYSDAARSAYPGFNDLITFRDRGGHDEQVRIQWGARINTSSAGLNYQVWAAPAAAMTNVWRWDRPSDVVDLRRYPTQAWTRAIKFPSGEMPDNQLTETIDKIRWGQRFDDAGGTTPAMIDELGFQALEFPADADRPDYVELGEVPAQIYNPQQLPAGSTPTPLSFAGLDATADTISVHRMYWIPSSRSISVRGLGIPTEVFRADGGLVRIGDELIFYSEVDTANGQLIGCQRGVLGTTPQAHPYNALVFPVETFAMSRLQSPADAQAASFALADTTDFPDDGYIRIADQLEIIGYTQLDATNLSGPIARIDPGADDQGSGNNQGNQGEAKRAGGALFRGRFGTTAATYNGGDVVISMPFRYYDRYAERSDDPENSYVQFSWTKRGAIWKRVSWDQQPRKNVEVLALVRFAGGPEWDADKIVRFGQEGAPTTDRHKYLYEIRTPEELNLLNVESDRVEVRMLVRFAQGAYDHTQQIAPDEWKQTPEIRKLTVEFVAPTSVLNQE